MVAKIKQTSELALRIQGFEEGRMRWGVISDASWGNAKGGKTQGGHLLITFDKNMLLGEQAPCNILHWEKRQTSKDSEQHTGCGDPVASSRSRRSLMDDGDVC